jgi:hypothetical protein
MDVNTIAGVVSAAIVALGGAVAVGRWSAGFSVSEHRLALTVSRRQRAAKFP